MKKLTYDELAEKVSFPEFLVFNGYKPVRKKGAIVYGKGEKGKLDQVRLWQHSANRNLTLYKSNNNEDDKGNIIHFVTRRIDQFSNIPANTSDYDKVNKVLHDYLNIPLDIKEEKIKANKKEILETTQIKENKSFNYHLTEAKKLENYDYLKGRGIDVETLNSELFKNTYVESKYHYFDKNTNENIVSKSYFTAFPLFSRNNSIIGIQVHRKNDKRFGADTNRTEGMWKSNIIKNKTNAIAIGEEAIDCISHSILHNQESKYAYMASFGSPSSRHANVIEKALIDNGISNLALINDNDKAGQEFNFKYLSHFINKEHHIGKVDEDEFTRTVSIDKSTFPDTKLANMINALKRYNVRIEKEINLHTKNEELKKALKKIDHFKISALPKDRISFKFPRLPEALFLFNKQVLGLVGFRIGGIRIKLERSITKDWNDDLKISKKHSSTLNKIEQKELIQKSKKHSI